MIFQSSRPVRGATSFGVQVRFPSRYFNPRAPCGARRSSPSSWLSPLLFQSSRPVRGATGCATRLTHKSGISILAPRAGRDLTAMRGGFPSCTISILAPRAGRDDKADPFPFSVYDFNPRAPCGARPFQTDITAHCLDFNPRAPCGARPPSSA